MVVYKSKFSGEKLVLSDDVCCDNPAVRVGRCPKTGLVQLVEFSHISDNFYSSEEYLSNFKEDRIKQKEWNRKRLDTIFKHIPGAEQKNVLDYGCGSGGFLESAKGKFKSIVGFDLSKKMCEENSKLGFECFNQMDEIPKDIEMITLFHVLEHVKEPWSFLRAIKGLFPEVSIFVIEVPNTNEALITLYKNGAYRKNHFSESHLYYFTGTTLAMVLERAGFKILINTQLQRYSLANHIGWISQNKGGGQKIFPLLNDRNLNDEYDKLLIEQEIADSVFIICSPQK